MKKEFDVFISYSQDDTDIAEKVLDALENAGLKCFMDRSGISAQDDWLSTLASAIQGSCIFLSLISRTYIGSDYSRSEMQLALMERKRGGLTVLPYLVDDGIGDEEVKRLVGTVPWLTRRDTPVGPALAEEVRSALRSGFIRKESAVATPRVLENHCYYHPERGVAAHCIDCSKNLCRDCAEKYTAEDGKTVPICPECAERRNKKIEEEKAADLENVTAEYKKAKKSFLGKTVAGLILGATLFCVITFGSGAKVWVGLVVAIFLFFLPFGLGVAAATQNPRNHPDNNPGCLLMLLFAFFGGIVFFFKDLSELDDLKRVISPEQFTEDNSNSIDEHENPGKRLGW